MGLFFWISKGNEIIVGEFAKIFETVVGVEILEDDKGGVCDTWRYRVEKSWKSGKAIQEQLLKRKHPISPLSSTKENQDTERVTLRMKPGNRLTFDYSDSSDPIPIRPNRILAEALTTANEVSCQTSRTLCTVISWSFPLSVDIVVWPMQQRFAYHGKFQKLCATIEEK